jgi:hypothetical protein
MPVFEVEIDCFSGKNSHNCHTKTALTVRGANFFRIVFGSAWRKNQVETCKIENLTSQLLQ